VFKLGACSRLDALNDCSAGNSAEWVNQNTGIALEEGKTVESKSHSVTVNLSNKHLSKIDIDLLDKGLSFIPTCNSMPLFKFYDAQNRLIRNLKIKDYFSNRSDKDYDYRKKNFTPASNWTPPDHHVGQATLDTIQHIVTNTETTLNKFKIHQNRFVIFNNRRCNLTHSEKIALNDISNDDSIIIKPADKGGATVIMNKTSYLNEAYRQLNNTNYYSKLETPLWQNNVESINTTLKELLNDGYINHKQFKFLQANDSDRQRTFYLLPKIHKPREKWPQTDMPEGRPIVSDCGSESYRISQFIDSHVRPISIKHFAYIKDTYDFIDKIRGRVVPRNAFLVTGDVTSLYTNMNIERTLLVTKEALDKHSPQTRLNQHLLDLLQITLQNNDFAFNGDYFLQTCGTAMGKAYAPGLADLYMQEIDNKVCHEFKPELIDYYFRFLDDIIFVWYGTMAELENLELYMNSLIPGIKITLNVSADSINFLDTTIYKSYVDGDINNATLLSKVYFKDTDTHQLVHKSSFHPKHTFRGVLKSQLLRFKRISSTFVDYDNACIILFSALSKRNYSKSFLRKMKRDVWAVQATNRKTDTVITTEKPLLPIVIPFCNTGHELSRSWKNFIKQNDKFENFRLITAYCNSKNLGQKLVRSNLYNNTVNCVSNCKSASLICDHLGMHRCSSSRCKACNYIKPDCVFKSTYNGRCFKLKNKFTCKSVNVIYLITCKRCSKQYVGQTGRALGERICDHLSNIRTHKSTPVALHFNLPEHLLTDFCITAIEKIPDTENALNVRLTKETTWQHLLQTAFPLGINNLKPDYLV